ncbi:MAG: hypothetical protein MI975_25435 [Cytophagales bacterium]|nr:hypothetical protein [Cytophagales bacterium]
MGIIVNTEVLDHLIISEKSYLSFADVGLMNELRLSTRYVPAYKLQQQIKKEAKEIGRQAGVKEGIKERNIEIAREMKADGAEIDMIVK